jgi:hypothetical protein
LALALAAAASPLAAAPSFGFFASHLTVVGVTPDSPVAVLGVAHEPRGAYQAVATCRSLTPPADREGTAVLELGQAVAPSSLWAAVDLASGALAVGAPEGAEVRQVPLAGDALVATTDGAVEAIRHPHRLVELLLVRPGVGAWGLRAGDGGTEDFDGAVDDAVTLLLERLEGVGDGPAFPGELLAGDVLVLLDPDRLEVATTTVGPAAPGEGGAR